MKDLFTDEEREALIEAAGPHTIETGGREKLLKIRDAGIEELEHAFEVYAVLPRGKRLTVASYYFQPGMARAKRHAKWNAESTLEALRRTVL